MRAKHAPVIGRVGSFGFWCDGVTMRIALIAPGRPGADPDAKTPKTSSVEVWGFLAP